MTGLRNSGSRGFTLVELLVALFVFAILAAAGAGIMAYSIQSQDALAAASDRLGRLQLARQVLKADLGQVLDRRARDRFGDAPDVSFLGQDAVDGAPILAFVRTGWTNPGGLERRGSLQYVEYRIEGDRLIRRARLRVDAARSTPAREQVLLSGVRTASVSFMDQGGWSGSWIGREGAGRALPTAVALDLELEDIGRVRQLFLTPGGGS